MRFARVIGFVGFAAVLAALSGCGETKPAQASAPLAPAPVPAPSTPADTAFVASGPLVVENQVDLAAERAGLVAKIMAEPGTRVKKGQLLALLDDRQISGSSRAKHTLFFGAIFTIALDRALSDLLGLPAAIQVRQQRRLAKLDSVVARLCVAFRGLHGRG